MFYQGLFFGLMIGAVLSRIGPAPKKLIIVIALVFLVSLAMKM